MAPSHNALCRSLTKRDKGPAIVPAIEEGEPYHMHALYEEVLVASDIRSSILTKKSKHHAVATKL